MDAQQTNQLLSAGQLETPGLFPHLQAMERSGPVFRRDFGLEALPEQPGVLRVRGGWRDNCELRSSSTVPPAPTTSTGTSCATPRLWSRPSAACCRSSGRSRAPLLGLMECLHPFGGSPVGQAGLAREAGLANNTVAAGCVEQLLDLLCVAEAFAWDASRQRANRRRPRKYHFTNLLAAVAWHPARVRSLAELRALPPEAEGRLTEWLVAQELWRRAAIRGEEIPEAMHFYQGKAHEVDFVVTPAWHVEVRRGDAGDVAQGDPP